MATIWCGLQRFFNSVAWRVIGFPFVVSRLALILVAWFGRYFVSNPGYSRYLGQGYFLSPTFLVDIWSRWDAEWYLSIVKNGYVPSQNLTNTYSNLAFFPLYPYLVRGLTFFKLNSASGTTIYLAAGILLSTVLFLAALYLLYKLVMDLFGDEALAERSIWLLLAFPAGFFFTCFYTESLFLFLSLALFWAARRQRWWLAGVLAALASLSRPQGILILLPLMWFYLEVRQWKLKAIRLDILSFCIAPLALLGHFYELYRVTGDPLAFFHAEAAWGRMGDNPRGDLIQQLSSVYKFQFRMDVVFYIVFLAAGIFAMVALTKYFHFPSRAYGLYVLVMLSMPIVTGSWVSLSRFLVVLFPVFIVLGWASRKKAVFLTLLGLFIAFQVLYFLGFTMYYFIA